MDELEKITACPMCAHHCPIENTSCRRGNDYAAWLYSAKEELREKQAREERETKI